MTMSKTPYSGLLLLSFVFGASSLSCYICGDANLDEFGECGSQFQYDCNDYARRFPSTEKIYCRSTRTKNSTSNTYTIMKECISEHDHYTKYPEKGYSIDEECDLVDVKGVEMAYCLCRTDNCNRSPIAEQFMDFEKKHPELFGDIDEAGPPSPPKAPPTFRAGEAPLKIQPLPLGASFAAPILNPPAIVPVNDLRTQQRPKSSESDLIEIRRSQLPSRAAGIETEISSQPQRPISNSRESEVPLMNLPRTQISEGTFVGSGQIVPKAPQLPQVPQLPQLPNKVSEVSSSTMRCVQCGDGSLKSINEECKRQVQVECASERSLCFTRQIELGNGMYGMEKMCVLPEQLVNEFGESARTEGCGSSNGGRVQYCACSSPVCNQIPLAQQRLLLTAIAPSQSHNVPDLASPELPQPPRLIPTTAITPTTTSTQPPRPIIPSVINKPAPGTSGSKSRGSGLVCLSCAEADMTDPTADCSAINEEACDESAKFCVTKQTQISTSSFAIEKRCLSDKDAQIFLPGEKLSIGCATSEGGLVNYCICRGNMCNRASLLQQAQSTGVRDSLEEQRLLEEEIQKSQRFANVIQPDRVPNQANVGVLAPTINSNEHNPKPKLPPVFLDNDDDLEVAKDVRTEEDIIKERQREWARATEQGSSSSQFLIYSSFIVICYWLL